MMKNRKLVKGIALAAVITALAAGGTAAYLTDFETATNSFTVGKVDIDLDEPRSFCSGAKSVHVSRGWHQKCTCKNRAVQLHQKQGLDTAGADRSGAEYGLHLCI